MKFDPLGSYSRMVRDWMLDSLNPGLPSAAVLLCTVAEMPQPHGSGSWRQRARQRAGGCGLRENARGPGRKLICFRAVLFVSKMSTFQHNKNLKRWCVHSSILLTCYCTLRNDKPEGAGTLSQHGCTETIFWCSRKVQDRAFIFIN